MSLSWSGDWVVVGTKSLQVLAMNLSSGYVVVDMHDLTLELCW